MANAKRFSEPPIGLAKRSGENTRRSERLRLEAACGNGSQPGIFRERLCKPRSIPWQVAYARACALSSRHPCFGSRGSQRARSAFALLKRRQFERSPRELLARVPFPVQPPELFKMTWMTLRKMTKNYPHELQRLGIAVLTPGQEKAYGRWHPW